VSRFRKKMMAKQNWYKDRQQQKRAGILPKDGMNRKEFQRDGNLERIATTTSIFVPTTMRVPLTTMLKEQEDKLANMPWFRVKQQEAGGVQMGKIFSTDLVRNQPCGIRTSADHGKKEDEIKKCREGVCYT
jgi:hypothetical protein